VPRGRLTLHSRPRKMVSKVNMWCSAEPEGPGGQRQSPLLLLPYWEKSKASVEP